MDELKKQLAEQDLSVKALLLQGWLLTKELASTLVVIAVAVALPVAVLQSFLQQLFPVSVKNPTNAVIAVVTGLFSFLASTYLMVAAGLAVEVNISGHKLSVPVAMRTSFERFKKKFRTFLLLMGWATLPLAPALLSPFVAVIAQSLMFLVPVISIAALAAGVWLFLRYIFVPFITTLREHSGKAALRASSELSSGFQVQIGIIMLLTGLVSALLAIALSFPFFLMGGDTLQMIASRTVFHVTLLYAFVTLSLLFLNRDYRKNGLHDSRHDTLIAMDRPKIRKFAAENTSSAGGKMPLIARKNLFDRYIKSEKLRDALNKIFQDRDEKNLYDLLELERENPNDTRIKIKIGEMFFKKKLIEEAIEKLESAAQTFATEQFHLKAIDVYKKILRIKPDFIPVNLKLADLYLKLNLVGEAANQIRIALNHYAQEGDMEHTRALAEKLVHMDPSLENRVKLAETYQSCSLGEQAVEQYELIAREYRLLKDYEKLLHFYELIIPHRPGNKAILKDICILFLKKKNPQRAMHFMEHYKVMEDPNFRELADKANLMFEALRRQKTRKVV